MVEIALDQFFLTLKILIRNGIESYTSPSVDIANPEEVKELMTNPNKKGTIKRICSMAKNTVIAFFSFVLHRIFLKIPQLPRFIKSSVSCIFLTAYFRRY